MAKKPLLVSMGDVNGLGPELACRVLGADRGKGALRYGIQTPLILVGSEQALRVHLSACDSGAFWRTVSDTDELAMALGTAQAGEVLLFEPRDIRHVQVTPGQPDVAGGFVAGRVLQEACTLLHRGLSRGIVTLPLHKAMLQQAGFDVPGHTEFLARHAGLRDEDVCMHLCGDLLRVSLVTMHTALRHVPDMLTLDRICHCLALTADFVNRLGVGEKPLAVCGLNPHAGEEGRMGLEDADIIAPAVCVAQRNGIHALGPYPADTVFYRAAQGEFSAVLAMYHDQGLGPLKLLHFSQAVNVTLGLPYIRTSVDHGTGFEITGTGKADTGSFIAALRLADTLCAPRSLHVPGD